MPTEPISFGICLYPIQALDVVGFVDILTNLGPSEIANFHDVPDVSEQTLLKAALDITFHWVSNTMDPVPCTGAISMQPTCTYLNAPKFDYLLVGGGNPDQSWGDSTPVVQLREFLQQQENQVKKIFTTCTGALTVASSGIMDGHEATVNHACVAVAKEKFPNVKWIADKNWIEGEKFWTSSGAAAGMDMAGQWVRQFPGGSTLLYISTIILEWRPRDVHGKSMGCYNGSGKWIHGDH